MGVKALGYVVIETRNPEAWDRYLTQIVGLMPASDQTQTARHYRMDNRCFRFRIETGEHERLIAPGWDMGTETEFNACVTALGVAGTNVSLMTAEQCAQRCVDGLAHATDPSGNSFEIFYGNQTTDEPFVSPAGVSGFVLDGTPPMGMGHAVVSAPNFQETHHFYCDVLGFGNTDLPSYQLGGPDVPPMRFAFLHSENGRHHSLALGEMPVTPSNCIHLMLEVRTLEDVGLAYDRMRLAGIPMAASLGKHTNDQMTSFYMQTPGGFDLEIGWGGLVIDPKSWSATAHNTISVWGHVWSYQAEAAQ
jgi:3,4-dihydroxy-9,10-secoandrosta-1,3,5(10)-triene-9,17-dione 4,5-dioxygenase